MRAWLVLTLLAAAILAALWSRRVVPAPPADPPRLTYVATASQLGVVGYRDPVGAIAMDGMPVVFTEGRRLYETAATGGARRELAAGEGQIRYLALRATAGESLFED